jgi:hypothetical protein
MKHNLILLGQIIGKFVLLFTLWIISIVIAYSLTSVIERQGKPISTFLFEFIPFLGLVIGHFVMTKFIEKSNLTFARISKSYFLRNVLLGFGIGLLWLTLSVLPIFFLGQGRLSIDFTMTSMQLLVYFVILCINAGMQELLIHGYLLSLLQREYSMNVAIVTTSLLFLLLHPGAINSGVIASINVFGAGLLFGLMTIKYDSLTVTTLAHGVWNYFGAVWLGLIPLDNYPSMKLISLFGNPLIVGGKNGIETSIIVTMTMMIFVLYLWKSKSQRTMVLQ